MRPRWSVVLALVAFAGTGLSAQILTVRAISDELHVRTEGLGLIAGDVLERLQDGRSVRVDIELTVLDGPRGAAVAASQQSFNLSFDLWEQRYAVTRLGPMPRSISHLTARAAEEWCLDNVTVPAASLNRVAGEPFWVRLFYRIEDRSTAAPDDSPFTLQTLIDALSRRREEKNRSKSVEAGPFRLTP